jgi:hypothetical protein
MKTTMTAIAASHTTQERQQEFYFIALDSQNENCFD